jgi:hypothetical protein
MIHALKHNILNAKNRMKQFADRHRSDCEFAVGDWVYVKVHPYCQTTLRFTTYSKLAHKYFGPFLILARIGKVAYKLDLLEDV